MSNPKQIWIGITLAWPSDEGLGLTVMGREFNPSTVRSCITEALSGEGHGLTVMWREFNPSTTRSCITEALSGEGLVLATM